MTRYRSRRDRDVSLSAHVVCGGAAMAVRAADAWNIARFCALVAEEANDDITCRSLVNIRDVWIDIANECELLAGRLTVAQR